MAELADAPDLGSGAREGVWVRVPPRAQKLKFHLPIRLTPPNKIPVVYEIVNLGNWHKCGKTPGEDLPEMAKYLMPL